MNAVMRWLRNRRLADARHVAGHTRYGICVDPKAHGLDGWPVTYREAVAMAAERAQ